MKYIYIFFMLLVVTLIQGCKDDIISTDLQEENTGNIQFKIDTKNAPENVATVIATLTRTGFETINSTLNLLTDSSASIILSDIPEGKWLLEVKAFDQNQKIVYKGEEEIDVISSTTIQVSLVLYPVSQGVGNVNIYVTWGNQSQWIDYSSNPIINSAMFPSNPPKVSEGKVIYHNGKYKMWYNVVLSGAKSSIYYAESIDGLSWTVSTQAALEATYSSWDNKLVLIGGVIIEDSCLRMFYSGADYYGNLNIGTAISNDGKTWIKSPQPLFSNPAGLNVMGVNSVLKVNNEYYLYLSVGRINYLAKSSNLSTWNFYQDILVFSGNWEYNGAVYTSVIYKNQIFKMIYQVPLDPSFYMATSTDGIIWNKSQNPIFDNNSIAWANSIAYPNYFIKNNEERIYYTGTSKTTGNDNIAVIYKR